MAFVIVTNEITVGKTASEIAFTHNKGVGTVSYTHLDVYKRQALVFNDTLMAL